MNMGLGDNGGMVDVDREWEIWIGVGLGDMDGVWGYGIFFEMWSSVEREEQDQKWRASTNSYIPFTNYMEAVYNSACHGYTSVFLFCNL